MAALKRLPIRCISSWTSTVMNTVLPDCRAPTSAIMRLLILPKCTGKELWQTGQIRFVVSPPQSWQTALVALPSPWNTGGSRPARPVRSCNCLSVTGSHRFPVRLGRPVQRNMICRSVNEE